ncbi:hypothetical protein CCR95_16855 [Thiocystis minor]|uniref:DUF427 domain-containing protein n=1 Tax=Thiocystis minor TaxID=61597 RepID=UPI00191469F3|nr:DUF427 domain-containing protein [Thiocystis minor]MBK5965707.1 hypothetical protein [Thiocystis minor]
MAKAVWKNQMIAESDTVVEVEGNLYFPLDAVRREFLEPSERTTRCPWKGEARYYHIVVGNDCNVDAAWFYPDPKPAASNIKGHVAFWRGVTVER